MADAGRDITEEAGLHARDQQSQHLDKRESFTTVNKDFGVGNEDVPDLTDEPMMPGRKRMLLLACLCILGMRVTEGFESLRESQTSCSH